MSSVSSAPLNHAVVLTDWQRFYVLVGSSAAALTGLTFIVITLAAERGELAASAPALYAASGVVLLLLFIGVHNAWDVVVWVTTERHANRDRQHR